jgi:hypothetical protein
MGGHGSGSGGARPGSGSRPSESVDDTPFPVIDPPEYCLEDERAIWVRLAPSAAARRTLTVHDIPGFYNLCQAQAFVDAMKAKVLKDDFETTEVTLQMDEAGGGLQNVQKKKHHLISELRGWVVVVKAGLKDFDLTSMGKPRKVHQQEKPKSALEQLGQRPGIRAVK